MQKGSDHYQTFWKINLQRILRLIIFFFKHFTTFIVNRGRSDGILVYIYMCVTHVNKKNLIASNYYLILLLYHLTMCAELYDEINFFDVLMVCREHYANGL